MQKSHTKRIYCSKRWVRLTASARTGAEPGPDLEAEGLGPAPAADIIMVRA